MATTLSSAGSDTPAGESAGVSTSSTPRAAKKARIAQDPARACAGLERASLGVAHPRFTPAAALPSAAPIASDRRRKVANPSGPQPRANSTTTVEPRLKRPISPPRATRSGADSSQSCGLPLAISPWANVLMLETLSAPTSTTHGPDGGLEPADGALVAAKEPSIEAVVARLTLNRRPECSACE